MCAEDTGRGVHPICQCGQHHLFYRQRCLSLTRTWSADIVAQRALDSQDLLGAPPSVSYQYIFTTTLVFEADESGLGLSPTGSSLGA